MEEIRYVCPKCGYEFKGNFNGLNANWACPGCKLEKNRFMHIKEVKDDSGAKVMAAHYDSLKEWKMDPKGFISKLRHSANIGMELMKAEICLKLNLEYVQDDNFPVNKVRKI